MSYPTKCRCGNKNDNGSCKNCSRVKMSIMLKNNCDDLKLTMPNGAKVNPVWYNYIKDNNSGEKMIIAGMIRRFKSDVLFQFTNKIIFYDNQSKIKIAELSL